jgi:RNA polymerase sigma factor (sigma-70 family)
MIGTLNVVLDGFIPMDETPPRSGGLRQDMAGVITDATASFELVLRANSGDQQALEALFARYLPRLQRWAHGRLPRAARGSLQTYDLVQDTLTRVFQGLSTFSPRHEGAFQGYVRVVLYNRIRDIAREYQRKGPSGPLDSAIPGSEWSPLDLAIGSETDARYEAALNRLRPEDRELIVARVEMRLPYPEIAAMFGKPSAAAVHMAMSRALVRLAREMAHDRKR